MRITVKWRPPAPSSDISTKLYVSKDSGLPRTHFTVAHGAGWIQIFIYRQSQIEAHSLSLGGNYDIIHNWPIKQLLLSRSHGCVCCIGRSLDAIFKVDFHTPLFAFLLDRNCFPDYKALVFIFNRSCSCPILTLICMVYYINNDFKLKSDSNLKRIYHYLINEGMEVVLPLVNSNALQWTCVSSVLETTLNK